MISDTLFEAIREIERYQRDFPQCYDEMREEIGEVKASMRRLQKSLDDPRPRQSPRDLTVN